MCPASLERRGHGQISRAFTRTLPDMLCLYGIILVCITLQWSVGTKYCKKDTREE